MRVVVISRSPRRLIAGETFDAPILRGHCDVLRGVCWVLYVMVSDCGPPYQTRPLVWTLPFGYEPCPMLRSLGAPETTWQWRSLTPQKCCAGGGRGGGHRGQQRVARPRQRPHPRARDAAAAPARGGGGAVRLAPPAGAGGANTGWHGPLRRRRRPLGAAVEAVCPPFSSSCRPLTADATLSLLAA